MPTPLELSLHFFLQLAVILVVCRLLWTALRPLRQAQVVAIMVAGFLLGPTMLGAVAPAAQNWLFPQHLSVGGTTIGHPSLSVLYVVGQLGLVLYMFVVGLAFDTGIFVKQVRESMTTAFAGVAVPLLLGGAVGWLLSTNHRMFPAGLASWQAALFFGSAIAVSAFPMLAWIVHQSGLTHTRVGTMALSCAAVDDGAAWILLAAVVAGTRHSATTALVALVGGLGYVVVMLTAGRRLLARLNTRFAGSTDLPPEAMAVAILVALVCAWFTDLVGIYSVFGAFLAGAVMPRGRFAIGLRERIEPVTAQVLLPAFFVYSGLNTHLNFLLDPMTLGVFALTLIVAFAGKGVPVLLTARVQGMTWREAGSLGALMNARGLMELVLLNIGLQAHLVTPALYTVLALMTVVTTFAASPIHLWMERRGDLRHTAPPARPIRPLTEPAAEHAS